MPANLTSLLLCLAALQLACSDGFLDEKPSSSLLVPNTLTDCRRLLDDETVSSLNYPGLGILGADEFYVGDAEWRASSFPVARNAYRWSADPYEGLEHVSEWNASFAGILAANAVLDVLDGIPETPMNRAEARDIKGAALFLRAYRYFCLAEVFAPPYDPEAADRLPGLPIRRSADIDYIAQRSSLRETYGFIIADLEQSASLVADGGLGKHLNRASGAAAYGALAKVLLVTKDYGSALRYASDALALSSSLMDYNDLPKNTNQPFRNNPEIIFSSLMHTYDLVSPYPNLRNPYVDTVLYRLYAATDLRKQVKFTLDAQGRPRRNFLYSHTGMQSQPFCGISTNELYLIRAECLARLGRIDESMATLNALLRHRYEKDKFIGYIATSVDEALRLVLEERRKELVFRGARWSDARRLNVEGAEINFTRSLDGQTFRLEPGSAGFTFPLPDAETRLGGLEQNPRSTVTR